MKNMKIGAWLLFCCFALGANAQTVKKKSVSTTVQGVVNKSQRPFFILKIQGVQDTIKLDSQGKFELFIDQHQANYFTIEVMRQELVLFALPYDTLTLTLNGSNLIDAKDISGKSAAYCDYLVKKQRAERVFHNALNKKLGEGMTAEDYYAELDSVRNARLAVLRSESKDFISPFTESETKAIQYQMANDLLAYKSKNNKEGLVVYPFSFDKFINSQSLNDESVSYLKEYSYYAENFISQKALDRYYADANRSVLKYYEYLVDEVCKNITSEKNKSIVFSGMMPQILKEVGTQDLTNLIARLESCSTDEKLIRSVKGYAAQFEHLYPGRPAPDAVAFDIDGKNYRLSDFKGKVIYIDTWATWCGPCKREIPHLKTLESEYEGKNVQFLSISTDRDLNAWKNFITTQSMGGLQLHQSDNPQENMSYLYMVNSIPRFVLIDSNGNLVSADAPRPSSDKHIRGILDQLLEE